jgi:hypothetical protein
MVSVKCDEHFFYIPEAERITDKTNLETIALMYGAPSSSITLARSYYTRLSPHLYTYVCSSDLKIVTIDSYHLKVLRKMILMSCNVLA